MATLVSIVIDNYNYERFLPIAIDSALAQTCDCVEIVVVDDGSTDRSAEILADYGSRIVPVIKANGGQASALNAGFAACKGDVVIFLDSDDTLYPTAVADVLAVLTPETAKVHGALTEVDADGRDLGTTNPADASTLITGLVRPLLLSTGRYPSPVMSGNAYPRWVLDRIMPVPEEEFTRTADGYLVALAGLYGPVAATQRPVGTYRRHGGNGWGAQPSGASLSGHLERELGRYRELRREAAKLGLRVDDKVEQNDVSGLRTRIASLRLAGPAHPIPSDTRLGVVWAGVTALWRTTQVDVRRRLLFSIWFPVVGLAPLPLARRAVLWLYVASARPSARPRTSTAGVGSRSLAPAMSRWRAKRP